VGTNCPSALVTIWGWPGLGTESIEAISQASSNNEGGQTSDWPERTLVDYLLGWESSRKAEEVVPWLDKFLLCLATSPSNLLQVSRSLRAEFNFPEKGSTREHIHDLAWPDLT
jgi:hypothetical protein